MTTAQQNASPGVYVSDDVGLEVTDGVSSRVQLGLLPIGVGNYGLRVVSADGTTVIIDGTSDVFKVVASGTLSAVIPATGAIVSASVSLPALGVLATIPANLTYLSNGTGTNQNRNLGYFDAGVHQAPSWAASASLGTNNTQFNAPTVLCSAYSVLNGSSNAQITIYGSISGSSGFTLSGRYYLFTETAL